MEDVLEGKESNFVLRTNRGKGGESEQWPDSSAYDYMFRDKKLEHMCLYEMTMRYEK